MSDERDPYADVVPPPDESDGPQEPVDDDSELEEESHPTVPESQYRFEWRAWPLTTVHIYDARAGRVIAGRVVAGQFEEVD
jgi:hypothetical protein